MSPSCLIPFSFPFLPGSNLWRSVSWRTPRPSSSCRPPTPARCWACWRSSASVCPRRSENPKQGLSNSLAFQVFDFSSQEHFLNQHCQMMSFLRSCLSPKCHIPEEIASYFSNQHRQKYNICTWWARFVRLLYLRLKNEG